MSYKPRVWKSKEAITAPKLNNLEEAVANLYDRLYNEVRHLEK